MATTPISTCALSPWSRTNEPNFLPTGIPSLDCPRGRITEIIGSPSSGRTALLYRILAAASAQGEYTALVDLANSFDPASAAAMGSDLAALVWVRCSGNLEHAMKTADLLVHSGGFGVVALDLCDAQEKNLRRIPVSWWHRFRRAVEPAPVVFVVAAARPLAGSCSTLIAGVRRRQTEFRGRFPLLTGVGVQVAPRKPVSLAPCEVFAPAVHD